ncbi:nicotinamide riboside transporter PnuC [Flexithrix dorotheae]|uniref:nicotinamide riboside transporter PnuC n=1 Tax=Flexithrix dorotheae TaxID=70993 RepID=UPI00039B73A6|nr:nicotinamide riboside transporter PnuC [Flexithrix dorotheae]
MDLFSTDFIILKIGNYPLSLIELLGTISGLISVYLASKANIFTWPTGIINEVLFFLLFYQVQLYSDMLLQVYFLGISIYGWIFWKEEDNGNTNVFLLKFSGWIFYGLLLISGTVLLGIFMTKIHLYLPDIFSIPAAYPYSDAFTTVASVLALILLARKNVASWVLWILVDLVAIFIYFKKGILFIAWEYVVFLILATLGLFKWIKIYNRG